MRRRLHLMALSMALWTLIFLPPYLTEEEKRLLEEMRKIHSFLYTYRLERGLLEGLEHDELRSGLIGPSFSPLLTTVGDLEAKRCSTNPLWAVALRRLMAEMGVRRLLLVSSASFPGLLLSALKAAESLGLEVTLAVSLGGSNYGAIHPKLPWPTIEALLRQKGLIKAKASFYTPGGGDESGKGMSPEGLNLARSSSEEAGIELVEGDSLDILRAKIALMERANPDLLINIGGAYTSFMGDEGLGLRGGLLKPNGAGPKASNEGGLVAFALKRGVLVLNLVGVRALAKELGVPEEVGGPLLPRRAGPQALVGMAIFLAGTATLRRWWYDQIR